MMEIYNIISNIPDLLVVIVLTYSLGAGFWNMIFCHDCDGLDWIAYSIRIQIMRYRDLSYNLASVHWEHQRQRLWLKYHASVGVSYRDHG